MDRSIFARRSRATLWSCMRRCAVRGVWCVVMLAACATPPAGDPQGEIAALLARSASDWNRGDLAGFMSDYAHDSLTNPARSPRFQRSEEHTSELQSQSNLGCHRL